MTPPLLVDTDVLIDFLRGYAEADLLLRNEGSRMVLSSIVVAELYSGVRGEKERCTLDELTGLFPVIPVSRDIAIAGGIYRNKFAKTHGVGLADALIAATAQSRSAQLATLNVKHYPMFPDLKPAYVKNFA
ncbi:type II toxin-antitoxin system VapC family toxin [Kiritimatiella glycovorans]|uniref:Ribonuclease VapC n=1 Tax=Kiritimatiella glycovorans TaxID=1307763 RepID=A0A0G3EIN9_9BACT|nr:type II toxin-antitoxin system VapC family toxin [Kiritimatiella glycovorans]AKJ64685.1 putative ribonuclease VapC19 [Kiritimatiella glycovorans]